MGSLVQLSCGEEHCKQISLACVGSARSVWATLGLPPLKACVLSQSTLLKLWVALQENCLQWALGCMHFPGLSCSGSDSRVLHKTQTWLGLRFVPFPGLSRLGDQVLGEHTLLRCSASYHLPGPSHSVSWVCSGSTVSDVLYVSSRELISDCNSPGRCQPSRIPGRLG